MNTNVYPLLYNIVRINYYRQKPLHIQYMHYLIHTIRYILQTKQASQLYNIMYYCITVYCIHGYTLVQVYSQLLFCRKSKLDVDPGIVNGNDPL